MSGEYTPRVLAELEFRVARNLERWGLSPATSTRLLNVSENATFLLSDPRGGRELVLRVHRVGYSSVEEIRSELAWINALRADGVIETAAPVTGSDGELVQTLAGAGGDGEWMPALALGASGGARVETSVDARPRFAVAFERLRGREPGSEDALRWFERLGELSARMHGHARSWNVPAGFRRKRWDVESMVGEHGLWGPWRAAIGLEPQAVVVLERVIALIRARLEHFGTGPERFGLVHADLRLANLLVDGGHLRIIDFDDCGHSWFGYDFATAVSFIEHEAIVPALLQAWSAGYRRVSPLDAATAAEMPTFVVLRRILLTAWLASHAEVPFAREFGTAYTVGTVTLAQRLLRGDFLTSNSAI